MRKYAIAAIMLILSHHSPGAEPGVACLGQVIAGERSVTLAAPGGSVVLKLLVKRGDRVEAGAELARLRDYGICEASVTRAEREIAHTKTTLALVAAGERNELVEAQRAILAAHDASLRMHSRRKERYEALHTNSFVSTDQYEEVLNAFDLANAETLRAKSVLDSLHAGRHEEVHQAEARVAVAEAERDLELARLEAQRIRAPMAGEILAIHSYDGEAIGEAIGDRGILDLADTANMMVLAEVYETDIGRVRLGQKTLIRSPAFDGDIEGAVVEIQRQVQTGRIFPLDPLLRSDRRTIPVRVKPAADKRLEALNNAQVTVIIGP